MQINSHFSARFGSATPRADERWKTHGQALRRFMKTPSAHFLQQASYRAAITPSVSLDYVQMSKWQDVPDARMRVLGKVTSDRAALILNQLKDAGYCEHATPHGDTKSQLQRLEDAVTYFVGGKSHYAKLMGYLADSKTISEKRTARSALGISLPPAIRDNANNKHALVKAIHLLKKQRRTMAEWAQLQPRDHYVLLAIPHKDQSPEAVATKLVQIGLV